MKELKVNIGLINPKSPENVGSVLRAAGNYQANSVFYTGKRYPLAIKRKSGSVNMSRKVSKNVLLSGVKCLIDIVPKEMTIVCIEFAEKAIPLPEYQHPENAFYIFGPEDGSISQEIIDKANTVVYVPTIGCMNLAATVNVVLYDRLAKFAPYFESKDLIRKNRDINNRLKVRSH